MTGRILGNPARRGLFLLALALLAYMAWRAFPLVDEASKR